MNSRCNCIIFPKDHKTARLVYSIKNVSDLFCFVLVAPPLAEAADTGLATGTGPDSCYVAPAISGLYVGNDMAFERSGSLKWVTEQECKYDTSRFLMRRTFVAATSSSTI